MTEDTFIDNFDMPGEDFDWLGNYIEGINSLTRLLEERKNQPPVEMESVYIFYGTQEQFKNMSKIEIMNRCQFIGYFEKEVESDKFSSE